MHMAADQLKKTHFLRVVIFLNLTQMSFLKLLGKILQQKYNIMNFKSNRICTRCHKNKAFSTDGLGYLCDRRGRPICISCYRELLEKGIIKSN